MLSDWITWFIQHVHQKNLEGQVMEASDGGLDQISMQLLTTAEPRLPLHSQTLLPARHCICLLRGIGDMEQVLAVRAISASC